MKKYWKYLGIAALASVIPVRVKRENGRRTYQSLLFSVDVGPGAGGQGTDVNIGMEGVIGKAISDLRAAKNEAELLADIESVAVSDPQVIADEAQEAADEAQAAADEAQDAADEAQDAGDSDSVF